ncbi:hypothetical protein ACR2R6_14750 [Methylocaldum gracile subsp. desertum]|uniref:hypothetical protein n=1 Tax=Methylocaldum sp. GT1BW TaxID=3438964 RepID=UPI003DA03715
MKRQFTLVIVTHSLQQAARVSERIGFFRPGRSIEVGETAEVLTHPRHPLTKSYITGRIG